MRCIWNGLTFASLAVAAMALSGCVNEAGNAQRYRVFDVEPAEFELAKRKGQPFIINRRGHRQTIEPIDYQTKQWGTVRLLPNFVSDGSSLPFDDDPGSNMAAMLHDALYRGAPELRFLQGYPGRWTRQQADAAYCLQLKLQKASPRVAELNCRGVNVLGVSQGVWGYHTERRKAYWTSQERLARRGGGDANQP